MGDNLLEISLARFLIRCGMSCPAIGIPYILLGVVVGFNPSGENGPDVVRGLVYVFVGVPVIAYALSIILLRGYPLTRKLQTDNAAKLAARSGSSAV